jgi:hypothetical protein
VEQNPTSIPEKPLAVEFHAYCLAVLAIAKARQEFHPAAALSAVEL